MVEEILYPAMEDFTLDIIVGQGPSARSIKINLPRFTLIGATTRTGLITSPLRDRFGVVFRLEFYNPDELKEIVSRSYKNTRDFYKRRCSYGDCEKVSWYTKNCKQIA